MKRISWHKNTDIAILYPGERISGKFIVRRKNLCESDKKRVLSLWW